MLTFIVNLDRKYYILLYPYNALTVSGGLLLCVVSVDCNEEGETFAINISYKHQTTILSNNPPKTNMTSINSIQF